MINDKLDKIIFQSLQTSAPEGLEEKMLTEIRRAERRKRQLHRYTGFAAAAAAIFICAVGVLQNKALLDSPRLQSEKADKTVSFSDKPEKETKRESEKEFALNDSGGKSEDMNKTRADAPEMKKKSAPAKKAAPKKNPQPEVNAEKNITEDKTIPESTAEEKTADTQSAPHDPEVQSFSQADLPDENSIGYAEDTFSMAVSGGGSERSMKRGSLSELFSENYDYCTAIYKNILPQLGEIEGCTVTQITGNEDFFCGADGALTIIFPPGEGAPSELGELRLYAGIIKDGILTE